ncbi:MAG TPA: VCBS repeat-containing protein [Clostridiaceae bacterium]|nr:VCBS repeat-containing protein [Clostridiaceae bacterium]
MFNYGFRSDQKHSNVFAHARGDVNGDRVPENVYLTGTKVQDGSYITNITLVIQNAMSGVSVSIPLKENSGYNPTLFLGDFTGDGVNDILISIFTGGSGGIMIHYVYSFINNVPRLLFDFEAYNEQYKYDVTYKNNYKVEVISRENKVRYILDISYREKEYLDEIYTSDRKLKKPVSGFVNPLSVLYPVDFDLNKVYELLAFQKIAGRYNADSLGYIQNTLKWASDRFVLANQEVAIFGQEF